MGIFIPAGQVCWQGDIIRASQTAAAICRALGDRGAFYSLLGKGRIGRVDAARGLLAAARKRVAGRYGTSGPRVIVDRMLSFLASEAFRDLAQQ